MLSVFGRMAELHRWFVSSSNRDKFGETSKVLAGKQTRREDAQGSWSFLSSVISPQRLVANILVNKSGKRRIVRLEGPFVVRDSACAEAKRASLDSRRNRHP